jgi:gluconate 2-dehydrogenase alpha chain
MSGVQIFVEDEINPFIGTGVNPAAVDDFQGDNFDHAGLGFFQAQGVSFADGDLWHRANTLVVA